MKGIVVKFDARKGFGFIRCPEGGDDAFVHVSDVEGRAELVPGQRVTFDLAETPKGPAARNVQPGGRPASPAAIFLVVAAAIVGGFVGAALHFSFPWLLAALAGLNAATFALYGYDKAVAGGRKLRVPEAVLHLLAALGGTPAAFLGQKTFRHKTVKGSFRLVFWSIALLQAGLIAGWFWCWRNQPPWIPEVFRFLFPRA